MHTRASWGIARALSGALLGLTCASVGCGDDAGPALGTGDTARPSGPNADDGPTGSTSSATTEPESTTTDAARLPTTSADTAASGSSSTGAVGHAPIVSFVDVAVEVGIDQAHGTFQTVPNCLIDQAGPGMGGFCIAERMAGASAVGDFDDDGFTDLFFARTYGQDRLYRNRGDGTFEDVAVEVGLVSGDGSNGVVFADFDNDGDQDLYLTRLGATRYELYISDGGMFTEQAIERGAALGSDVPHSPTSVAVGDYDLDGYLDLYVGEWKTEAGVSEAPSHSRLLHNLGELAPGHFEDVTDAAGLNIDAIAEQLDAVPGTYAFAPNFADLDGDGLPDLTVTSDFRCTRLFWNNGDGTFLDGTVLAGVGIDRNGMGSTMGDFDGDGDLDWFITAITQPGGHPENRFFRNIGDRRFEELGADLGVGSGGWGWGTSFLDADNDGDLDLAMTAGYHYTSYLEDKNRLWLNRGDGHFSEDVAPAVGLLSEGDTQGRGLNTFDYDGDGDVDVFLVNNAGYPNLFRNDTEDAGDWLQVRAVGTVSNRDGIGAKVTVIPELGGRSQYREIGTTTHYLGDGGREVHFGLGWSDGPALAHPLAQVRVYFPASGIERVLTNVARNQRLVITE